jgi:thiol-disulfide isomerase/thioredoxin
MTRSGPDRTVLVGSPAPEFAAKTLSGDAVAVPSDFRDGYVLVDFWATWCGPCRAEKPFLKQAQEQFGDRKLKIIGVSIDAGNASGVKSFVDREGITWPIVHDDKQALAQKFGVEAIPALFLIDGSTGKIVATGDELRGEQLIRTLSANLPGGAT